MYHFRKVSGMEHDFFGRSGFRGYSGFPVSCFRGRFLANETDLKKRVNAVLNFASHLPETVNPRSVNNFCFSRLLPNRPPTLN